MEDDTFSLIDKAGSSLQCDLPFLDIKTAALGEAWDVSLVLCTDEYIRELNKKYREKDEPTNVLAFSAGAQSGDVVISVDTVMREHEHAGRTPCQHIAYLFIHGLLHLKGYVHGSKMETEEKRLCKQFKLSS